MLRLDPQQVLNMTGWELLETLKLYRNQTRKDGESADFDTGRHKWHVYTSTGRGKHRGTYVHLWREIQRRVVDPDGTDTGLRVEDVVHVRGKADQRIREMSQVD